MLGGWERGLACCVRCLAVFWFPHRGSALETARGRLITTTTAAFRSKSTLLRGKPGSRPGFLFSSPRCAIRSAPTPTRRGPNWLRHLPLCPPHLYLGRCSAFRRDIRAVQGLALKRRPGACRSALGNQLPKSPISSIDKPALSPCVAERRRINFFGGSALKLLISG
jgi:hypothetical protein